MSKVMLTDCQGRLKEYQVVGRHLPSESNPTPKLYRMRIFAPNDVVAKSRFWYFLGKLRKIKKANGEIVSLNEVFEGYRYIPMTRSINCVYRSTKNVLNVSRTLVSGSDMTLARALTICTKNSEKCQGQMLYKLCTKIWLHAIALVSGLFM
jgi:hypothetical protein